MRTFLPGFTAHDIDLPGGIRIRAATGGCGPPLLLLHGHPQSHATWHRIAPLLARDFTVVATDLRGYGDSSRPVSDAEHRPYSKRAMARDQIEVMASLGFPQFAVAGHDRGGRVAHRLALDHPQSVSKIAVLDIAPTLHMYENTNDEFARRYFWWFFFIQPGPLPENLIGNDLEFFLRRHLKAQSRTDNVPDENLIAEYLRCYKIPGTVHAVCEDYRAAATTDLALDKADRDQRHFLTQPLLALWGAQGAVGELFDVMASWRGVSQSTVDGTALNCGHLLQEEAPQETAQMLADFFKA